MTLLTLDAFQHHQGSVFILPLAEGRLELLLTEVSLLKSVAPQAQRQPFALVFRGPPTPVLPQQIYALEHPVLGRQEIFMVPIGPDALGMNYEAIFT